MAAAVGQQVQPPQVQQPEVRQEQAQQEQAQQQKKSAFDAVVGFHNRSVEWVQKQTFSGITKTFGIQEEGDKADTTIGKVVKMVMFVFASILLLPLSAFGAAINFGRGMLCGKVVAQEQQQENVDVQPDGQPPVEQQPVEQQPAQVDVQPDGQPPVEQQPVEQQQPAQGEQPDGLHVDQNG